MRRLDAERPSVRPGTAGDAALLEAVRRRDRKAFALLYSTYHGKLFGYLRRISGNPAMAEELVDDVMYVVWKDARKFRGRSAVSSWIFGIAYRKAMTAIRKENRYHAQHDYGVNADTLPATAPADVELLRKGLEQLSPDHRQVLELTYFCGFSYREIAEIAGCPVNTVKTRMFHARKRLRHLLPVFEGSVEDKNHDHG